MLSRQQAASLAFQYDAGYWIVGDQCSFDKVEASTYASKHGFKELKYYFFDHLYSLCRREPSETLDELYEERARQLREKHSHIILSVSGGSDSTAMLLAFLRQGLRVDEIWSYFPLKVIEKQRHTFNAADKGAHQHMFEYDQAFLPLMELVKKKSPNTKIRVFDFTDHLVDTISGGKVDRFHYGRQLLHPGTAGPDMMFAALQQYKGQKAALVIGCDKPRVLYSAETGQYKFFFIDFQNFWSTANMTMGLGAPRVETFYYTASMPKIVQKQYYVLRQAIAAIKDTSPALYSTLWRPSPSGKPNHLFNMQEEFFEHLIYPNNPNHGVFQTKKPNSIFFNADADWAIGQKPLVDTRVGDFWQGQVKEFIHGMDSAFVTYNGDKPALLKHVSSSPIALP